MAAMSIKDERDSNDREQSDESILSPIPLSKPSHSIEPITLNSRIHSPLPPLQIPIAKTERLSPQPLSKLRDDDASQLVDRDKIEEEEEKYEKAFVNENEAQRLVYHNNDKIKIHNDEKLQINSGNELRDNSNLKTRTTLLAMREKLLNKSISENTSEMMRENVDQTGSMSLREIARHKLLRGALPDPYLYFQSLQIISKNMHASTLQRYTKRGKQRN